MADNQIGNYKILEQIGVGGTATIYKGVDVTIDRPVAIKVLHEHLQKDKKSIERFIGDAKALGQFKHPNIVEVYSTDMENHCFVMEYAKGKELTDIIRESGPLDVERGIKIARQIAEALRYIHLQRITHRDIKPQNIIIDEKDKIKLLDFSIAHFGDKESTTTASGATLGSVYYMSPEQIDDTTAVSHLTDIYSFGVIMYEMFTGRLPFSSESDTPEKSDTQENVWSIFDKIQKASFPEPSQLNPRIPQGLNNLIKKAMDRNLEDRYQTMGEILAVFNYLLGEKEKSVFQKPPTVKEKVLSKLLVGFACFSILGIAFAGYMFFSRKSPQKQESFFASSNEGKSFPVVKEVKEEEWKSPARTKRKKKEKPPTTLPPPKKEKPVEEIEDLDEEIRRLEQELFKQEEVPPKKKSLSPEETRPTRRRRYAKKKRPSEIIDINTATPSELSTLPGIGPKTSQKIINYRENVGPFKSIEEIMKVSGIANKKFARMKEYISVGKTKGKKIVKEVKEEEWKSSVRTKRKKRVKASVENKSETRKKYRRTYSKKAAALAGTKINLNTADVKELSKLPRVGPKTAQSIVDYRENIAPFKSVEEIMKIKGIGPKYFERMEEFITVGE